jgi:hypothetical protein
MKSGLKKNQVVKLKRILICFIYLLSIGHRTIKGVQHGDFDKTKVLKTQRDSKSEERKQNPKSLLKSFLLVRPVLLTGQTGWTYSRGSQVHQTCLVPLPGSSDLFRTCLV